MQLMNAGVTGWLSLGEQLQATPLLLALRVLPPLMMVMAMIELFTRRFYATGWYVISLLPMSIGLSTLADGSPYRATMFLMTDFFAALYVGSGGDSTSGGTDGSADATGSGAESAASGEVPMSVKALPPLAIAATMLLFLYRLRVGIRCEQKNAQLRWLLYFVGFTCRCVSERSSAPRSPLRHPHAPAGCRTIAVVFQRASSFPVAASPSPPSPSASRGSRAGGTTSRSGPSARPSSRSSCTAWPPSCSCRAWTCASTR